MSEWPFMSLTESRVSVLDCEHKTPVAQTMGHPYIAIPDLVDGMVDLSKARRISDDDLAAWTRRTVPQAGDILVTRRGRVGDTAVIPDGLRCAIGQNIVLLRTDEGLVRRDYLRHAARSPAWWSEVERLRNVGAVFSSLNVRDIARIHIPVPPIEEQRAIAEVLGVLDDKIAANVRAIEVADDLARCLTRRSLSPMEWVPLGSLASVTMGSSPPGASFNEDGVGEVFYQGVRDFGVRFPSNRVWTTQPVRMAGPGDTLLSVRAPVGRTNLAEEVTCIGRGLAAVQSLSGQPMSLFHALRADDQAWAPYEAEGTVFGSINKKELSGLRISTVLQGREAELEADLVALEEAIAGALHENKSLVQVRDTLLPLLMSGKVRVKDVEKQVEEVV